MNRTLLYIDVGTRMGEPLLDSLKEKKNLVYFCLMFHASFFYKTKLFSSIRCFLSALIARNSLDIFFYSSKRNSYFTRRQRVITQNLRKSIYSVSFTKLVEFFCYVQNSKKTNRLQQSSYFNFRTKKLIKQTEFIIFRKLR